MGKQKSAIVAIRLGGQGWLSLKSGKMNTTVRVAKSNMTFGGSGRVCHGAALPGGGSGWLR